MGDHRRGDELPARGADFVGVEREQAAQRGVRVIAQVAFVAHSDEHEVERPGFRVGAAQMAVSHQAVVDPAKMRRHPPRAFRTEELFFDHDGCVGCGNRSTSSFLPRRSRDSRPSKLCVRSSRE